MPQFEHDHERTLLQRERESHQDVVEERDGRRIVAGARAISSTSACCRRA